MLWGAPRLNIVLDFPGSGLTARFFFIECAFGTLEPQRLCRQHLLGEHRELHALWVILTQGKTGFAKHPETRRWRGKFQALYRRHERLVAEMGRRGLSA